MNLLKLEDLHVIPLKEIIISLNKNYEKLVVKSETNEISKEHNINEFESNIATNVIPKSKKFGELSITNTIL